MVSNPELGFVDNTTINGTASTTPVLGTTETGRFIAKYFINNGTGGGNQILTCMITLPNPNDIDPGCENVPENKRKVTASVLILHNPADLPSPDSIECTPNPVTGGSGGTCTCNATNAAGLEICISSPGSVVDINACTTADVSGTATLPFDTDVVDEQVIEQVLCTITEDSGFFANDLVCTCDTNTPFTQLCLEEVTPTGDLDFPSDPFCLDSDGNGNAIFIPTVDAGITENTDVILQCCIDGDDPADDCENNTVAQETVTITPFVPPVTSVSCTAQQSVLGPDGNTFIDISIDGFPFGQEVCTQIIIDGVVPGATVGPDDDSVQTPEVFCAATDGNGDASIQFNAPPMIALQRDVTVRCFPDTTDDDEFTAGEISAIEVITLDPNAGPAPVQVACAANPASVAPGENSFLTATLTNAGVGTAVCFEISTDTSPGSELMDDNEDVANDTIVCSTTNLANQAFATFEADPGILITDTANIICCADIGAGADDCEPDDPQTSVAVQVEVPVVTIDCVAQDDNIGPGDDTFIDISTTGLVPGPTQDVCVDIIIDTSVASGVGTPPGGSPACALIDANGNASIQFRGGLVPVLDVATVRCFVDNLTDNNMFTPGELSVTEQITVDPAAAPTPVQVGCSPFPATVLPGQNSLLTATLMNAAPGVPVCFEFFTNTTEASTLDTDASIPEEVTPVCTTTNLANQAFATFAADLDITGLPQTANIICCADLDAPSDDCDPGDPQTITAVDVDAPILTLVPVGDIMPGATDTRFINATTNPPVLNGTSLCVFMSFDNTGGSTLADDDPSSTTMTTTPPTIGAHTLCEVVTNGLGSIPLNFNLTIAGGAGSGNQVIIDGCINTSGGVSCGVPATEPPSANSVTFTVP
jgi:hypothetical protein